MRMITRDIEVEDVIYIAQNGETIFEYLNDKPYPSRLMLGWLEKENGKVPLHIVLAEDSTSNICIVITAYWPGAKQWQRDYKTKK